MYLKMCTLNYCFIFITVAREQQTLRMGPDQTLHNMLKCDHGSWFVEDSICNVLAGVGEKSGAGRREFRVVLI